MIKKKIDKTHHLRSGVTLEIEDSNQNSFTMEIGGNTDLYWVANGRMDQFVFNFKKDNEFYNILDELFTVIKKDDNPNYPTIEGNSFTWLSEDRPEEDANHLKIEKQQDKYIIEFNKNPGNFYPMCAICFCNSGSYHPNIEIHFMKLFNSLAFGYKYEEEPESK
ncbi:MAG: hypothetical protein IJD48_00680 [Clostridia bacterium]|nr:hypothetical protein [Clostridia bacterium]